MQDSCFYSSWGGPSSKIPILQQGCTSPFHQHPARTCFVFFDPAHPLPVERLSTYSTSGCNRRYCCYCCSTATVVTFACHGFVTGPVAGITVGYIRRNKRGTYLLCHETTTVSGPLGRATPSGTAIYAHPHAGGGCSCTICCSVTIGSASVTNRVSLRV